MFPGVTNEVPDDQKIPGETHLLNHRDLIRESRLIIGDGVSKFAARFLALPNFLPPPLESLPDNFFEIVIWRRRFAFGNRIVWQVIDVLWQFQIASLRNLDRAQ